MNDTPSWPRAIRVLALVGVAYAAPGGFASAEDERAGERARMMADIRETVALTREHIGKGALDERVMTVLGELPRHEFVPPSVRPFAYHNRPLGIGFGQTISQPYIVALMTDLAQIDAGDRVLEVGTGSGYQAAALAKLVDRVYTVEIIEPLARRASARLERLEFDNVSVRIGDGYFGWKAHAPFDAIVVTAAAGHVPPPLIEQLVPGGRMVIPVGGRFTVQQLLVVHKLDDGSVRTRQVLPVRFVPLTGER